MRNLNKGLINNNNNNFNNNIPPTHNRLIKHITKTVNKVDYNYKMTIILRVFFCDKFYVIYDRVKLI